MMPSDPPVIRDAEMRHRVQEWLLQRGAKWKRDADGLRLYGAHQEAQDWCAAKAAACEELARELDLRDAQPFRLDLVS